MFHQYGTIHYKMCKPKPKHLFNNKKHALNKSAYYLKVDLKLQMSYL